MNIKDQETKEIENQPTIIVKSVGKVAFFYLFFSFLPPPLAQCWSKR